MTALFETPSDNETEPSDSDSDQDAQGDVMELPVDEFEKNEELKLHMLGLSSYWSAAIETNFGTRLRDLPERWLAPGTVRMLWVQVGQERQEDQKISYQHFWKVFRLNWHQILKFLPSSTHGACDTCVGFKAEFRKALTPQQKFENARAYKSHIDEVCQDRDLEEFLQISNPLATPGAPLCIHFVLRIDLVHVVWRFEKASTLQLPLLFPGTQNKLIFSRANCCCNLCFWYGITFYYDPIITCHGNLW